MLAEILIAVSVIIAGGTSWAFLSYQAPVKKAQISQLYKDITEEDKDLSKLTELEALKSKVQGLMEDLAATEEKEQLKKAQENLIRPKVKQPQHQPDSSLQSSENYREHFLIKISKRKKELIIRIKAGE